MDVVEQTLSRTIRERCLDYVTAVVERDLDTAPGRSFSKFLFRQYLFSNLARRLAGESSSRPWFPSHDCAPFVLFRRG
jgi:hypothetical protein